jgi:hypothetical protein
MSYAQLGERTRPPSCGIRFNLEFSKQRHRKDFAPAHRQSRKQNQQSPIEVFYPRTLIFENDITARLGVGRPMDSAGRKVVKISICFTCGNTTCDSGVSERMR